MLFGAGAALIWMFWPQITGQIEPPAEVEAEDKLTLRAVTYAELDGWQSDDMRPVMQGDAATR